MSSHREAPAISKDPVADSTDTYAFVTPGRPDTVTIISNYIPGDAPAGGPHFYEFGADVVHGITAYPDLANAANHTVAGGVRVFAGQREDPFFVDLGSIFDLGALRPIQSLHLIPLPNAPGVNSLRNFNVHTIAIQVPISMLTRHRNRPTDVADPSAVIGVWAS